MAWRHVKAVYFPWCYLYHQFLFQLYLWRHETTRFDWRSNEWSLEMSQPAVDPKKWHNVFSENENKLILQKALNHFILSIFWLISFLCSFVFIWSIFLVNSIFDGKVVSTWKKKQQYKKHFSQLSEGDTNFMIGQSNHDVQSENIDSVTHRGNSSDNTNNLTQVNYPRVDMHTLEENIVSNVRIEVDIVMTTVETRV